MPSPIGPVSRPSAMPSGTWQAETPAITDPMQDPNVQQAFQSLALNIFQSGQAQCKEALDSLNKPDDDEESDDPDDAL